MLKRKTTLFAVALFSLVQLSCAAANSDILPELNKKAFPGFIFGSNTTTLKSYKFVTDNNEKVKFISCNKALNYDISQITDFNYFRFKLLLTSCKAMNKYKSATKSNKSFFSSKLSNDLYKEFPALATPFLSATEYKQRENKTIRQIYKSLKVTSKNNTATLITKEDEIYITVLARGDFNNDNIEDLLVGSEWYSKNARGKHTDLVILSKTGKDKAIVIDWRLNTLK